MSESKENEKETQEQTAEQETNKPAEESEKVTTPYEDLEEEELREELVARDQKLEELQQALSEAKDSHLRKVAEMDNYRKRVQRERSQIYETAKANAVKDFLDVNDDLQRTLNAADDLEVNDTFMDGVQLVANKFEEVLNNHGVERINESGVPFDVDLHDALMRQKDDSAESNVVLEVVENGYRLGDRTIRHAKVIVSE